jgi:hypothetical protein
MLIWNGQAQGRKFSSPLQRKIFFLWFFLFWLIFCHISRLARMVAILAVV